MQPWLDRWVDKNALILDVGCGNSLLCEAMRIDGFAFVVGVDFSVAGLALLQHRDRGSQLELGGMDVTALTLRAEVIDVVIDKGCMDALLNAYDCFEWSPELGSHKDSEAALEAARAMMKHVYRVLKPGGRLLLISLCKKGRTMLTAEVGLSMLQQTEDAKVSPNLKSELVRGLRWGWQSYLAEP